MTEDEIALWTDKQIPEPPAVVLKNRADLTAEIRRWIATITQRPVVLSFAEFNMWLQFNSEFAYTQEDALNAYDDVLRADFPHRFETNRVIRPPEWSAFFDHYGAAGIVGGTIDRATVTEALNTGYKSSAVIRKIEETRVVTYFFSEPHEAMFARVALV